MRRKSFRISILIGLILLLLSGCGKNQETLTDLAQLNEKGRIIMTWSGYTTENIMKKCFPEATASITSDSISMCIANVRGHKVDAFMIAKAFFDNLQDKNDLKALEGDLDDSRYGFFFAQSDKGRKLRDQMNEFIEHAETSGLKAELEEIWLGEDAPGRAIGNGSDDPNAEELLFAVENLSPPFGYVENSTCVGFDVDYAACFCKEYGYRMKVVGLPFPMIAAGDETGEYDFAGGALLLEGDFLPEKVVSNCYYSSPFVMIVRDDEGGGEAFSSWGERFSNTFIKGDRWKMYLNGLLCTLLLFISATLAGTMIGFLIYLLDLHCGKFIHKVINILFTILHITPTVVLLMIFYHIVFGRLNIGGLPVSIIVFALLMTGSVYNLMTASVATIDKGQSEAAIALGCTPTQAFNRIILPQALRHFIPLYKGELISLIKITSIVGYIAVQDLTKVSDIIQTRTFDAFVPLFTSAVIYILLALLLIRLINLLFRKTDPKNRSNRKILAGLEIREEGRK